MIDAKMQLHIDKKLQKGYIIIKVAKMQLIKCISANGGKVMLEIRCDKSMDVPKIMVIGVGGGGNNALDRMIASDLSGVNYVAVNTDVQVLEACKAEIKIQIGQKLTKGYGAGANPEIGETAALENEEEIRTIIEGADMCIITCGLGGGTGTGAAPVIAKFCKDAGILTVGVVTTPFSFENTPRIAAAQNGKEKLKANVDTLLVIPNDKLIGLSDKPLLLDAAFEIADSVLKYTVEGITNIIRNRGVVNLDFNDLRTTLANKGIGHLGIGTVNMEDSVLEAVKQAVNSPLLETSVEGAETLLINTSGKVNIIDLNEAISYVRELAGDKVKIIWGTVPQDNYDEDKIVVTLIATGMTNDRREITFIPKQTDVELKIPEFSQPGHSKEIEIVVPRFLQEAGKKREREKRSSSLF